VQLEMWQLHSNFENHHEYEIDITIMTEDGTITQKITGIQASYRYRRTMSWHIEVDFNNPLNFHFSDYNGDGYLDMGLRFAPGGSMMNDPHYIWLWDSYLNQFIRNNKLEWISNEGSIELMEDGTIHSSSRITMGHYSLRIFTFIDGYLTLIENKEINPLKKEETP